MAVTLSRHNFNKYGDKVGMGASMYKNDHNFMSNIHKPHAPTYMWCLEKFPIRVEVFFSFAN